MSWLLEDFNSVSDYSSYSYSSGDGDFDQYQTLRSTKGTLQQLVEDGRPLRRGGVVPPMPKEKADLIAERARTHPIEASFPKTHGFPLHVVLEQRPPLHVVEAVFNAYPAALLKARKMTVLRIACINRWCSQDVVRFLAQKIIAARARGEELNTRSHRLLSSFGWVRRSRISVEAVKVLLEEDPTVSAYEDRNFGLFIIHYFCDVAHLRNNSHEKMKLLLMAHAHGTVDEDSLAQRGTTFRPLHALLRCMIESATNPQYERLVESGITRLVECGERDFTEKDFTGSYPINILIESPRKRKVATASYLENIVKLLIREHPTSAAYRTACGRLPLHLAIENGWPTSPILAYAQSAISVRDVSTGLFPF